MGQGHVGTLGNGEKGNQNTRQVVSIREDKERHDDPAKLQEKSNGLTRRETPAPNID